MASFINQWQILIDQLSSNQDLPISKQDCYKNSKNYRPKLDDIAPAVVKVMLQTQEYPMEKVQGKFLDFH